MTETEAEREIEKVKYWLVSLEVDRGLGRFQEPYPEPGIWSHRIDEVTPGYNGWHLTPASYPLEIPRECLWVAEAREVVRGVFAYHIAAKQARLIRQIQEWNDRNRRLLAADCAERVLSHWETEYPSDDRPRKAIETARRFALGEASETELQLIRDSMPSAGDVGIGLMVFCPSPEALAAGFGYTPAGLAALAAYWSAGTKSVDAIALASKLSRWSAAQKGKESSEDQMIRASKENMKWQHERLYAEYLKLDPNDFH